jgi:hypothetical protein
MTTNKQKDLTQVKGGLLPAGLNLESVGSFLFMTYYNPQPIHPDECDLQIADYELKKEYHDYQRQEKFITLPQFKLAVMECDCWIIYYKRCKQLYMKGQQQ